MFLCVCLALFGFIKDCYFELYPHLVFLVPPCCVHRDRRPDLTVSGAPSPRFVLFIFLPVCSVCPHGMEVAARHPALAYCKSAWEFGGIAAAHPSPPFAGDRHRRPRLQSQVRGLPLTPSSRCPRLTQTRRPPLTEARRPFRCQVCQLRLLQARRCPRLPPSRRRPWLTQARRPRGNQCCRPAAELCPLARQQVPVDPVHPSRPGVPCHVPGVMDF